MVSPRQLHKRVSTRLTLQKDFSETNFWPDLFKTRFDQSYFTDTTDCKEKGGGGGG
jgi:hypothetical protein